MIEQLPYGLLEGQILTDDGGGEWVVHDHGLHDLRGDDDWDWPDVEANGGLGNLWIRVDAAVLTPLPNDARVLLNDPAAVRRELDAAGDDLIADLEHMAAGSADAARTTLHWYEQIRARLPHLTTDEALALAVVFYYG